QYDPRTSLYAFLRDRLDLGPADAEERIETVLASPREAALIGTNPALPMLVVHRLSWDQQGRPFERSRTLYRGDRFGVSTRLRNARLQDGQRAAAGVERGGAGKEVGDGSGEHDAVLGAVAERPAAVGERAFEQALDGVGALARGAAADGARERLTQALEAFD